MPKRPDLPCADCGTLMWRGKGVLPPGQARCRPCRSADRPRHGASGYKAGCRCAECREAKRIELAEYRAKRKLATGLAQKRRSSREYQDAECLGCGAAVRGAYRKDQPYHRACRERVERAERKRATARQRLARAAKGTAGTRVWVAGECAECLTAFTRLGQPSRFCSKACNRRARPARGKFRISRRDRLAIYERDGWTCQLCLEPVDRDLMTLDPLSDWAPSLDHVVPQAWQLIPDHSPSALRLAHRWCNSVRGDMTYYNDDDLRVA